MYNCIELSFPILLKRLFNINKEILECTCISGIVIQQMFNISMSSPSSDCSASVETGMPHLCKSERAFYGCICGGKNDTNLLLLL